MVKKVGKYLTLLKTVTMTTEEHLIQNIDGVETIKGSREKKILP